jgi:dihydrodipicolinate synthase/N-acetylneuraminate lyase
MEAQPFIAAAKRVLQRRGVPVNGSMRAPMRTLTAAECERLDAALDRLAALPALSA